MIVEEKTWPKRQLQRECKALTDRLSWQVKLDRSTIYIHPIDPTGWVALVMTRYQGSAVDIIRSLPALDRFFYQAKANRFKQLNVWCIRGECSEELIARLRDLPGLRVEPLTEGVSARADH